MALLKAGHHFSLFTVPMESVLDSKKKSVENELVDCVFSVLSF